MVKISKHKQVLERLIESSGILVENPRLDRYMCLVLMTELLFGVGKLNGESKPVECVRNFKEKFDAILNEKGSDLLANDADGVLVKGTNCTTLFSLYNLQTNRPYHKERNIII